MRQFPVVVVLILAAACVCTASAAPDCSIRYLPQPIPQDATALPPLTSELNVGYRRPTGAPDGVFAYGDDETQSVDRVLARIRMEACRPVAQAAGAYVPKTQWDNTPYRYNAGGNGKKFTADDFDAWMKAKGIHVSKGVPKTAPVADPGLSAPPGK